MARCGSTRILAAALLACAASASGAASVTVLPGSSPQSTYVQQAFLSPIRVLYLGDDGRPMANTVVHAPFALPGVLQLSGNDYRCGLDLGPCTARTDGDGVLTLLATAGTTARELTLSLDGALVRLTIVEPNQAPWVPPLWWGGPSESGWGVAIPQRGTSLFPVYFTYDSTGRTTWSVLEGSWSSGFGSSFNGLLNEYRGSPFYAFDSSKMRVASSHPTALQLDPFRNTAAMDISPYDNTVTLLPPPRWIPLQPYEFSPAVDGPKRGVSDIWWGGPSQSGWGITVAEDHGNLFLAWFTYDANGLPTWFSMSDGAWTAADTWAGPVYRASASVNGHYDLRALRQEAIGAFSIRFTDPHTASFAYSVDGHVGTLQLQRFEY